MGDFEYLKGYQPEEVTDGFEPIKGKYDCVVNYARIEEYSGDNEEFKGEQFFRYELEICDGQPNSGRKLWKSAMLSNEDKVKKLADNLFPLGLEFTSKDELLAVAEKFVEMTVQVTCSYFTPKDDEGNKKVDEEGKPLKIQMHRIKGIAPEGGVKSADSVPF